ncbi:Uncharacterized protein Rs2_36942 [Raphanus sativus]|nr:Uncharacterized protein Rs2_36942 [Raphanus sativus]
MFVSFFSFGVAFPLGGRPFLTPALCLVFSGERPASNSASYGTCVMTAALFWDSQILRLTKVMNVGALLSDEISAPDGFSSVKKAQMMKNGYSSGLDESSRLSRQSSPFN